MRYWRADSWTPPTATEDDSEKGGLASQFRLMCGNRRKPEPRPCESSPQWLHIKGDPPSTLKYMLLWALLPCNFQMLSLGWGAMDGIFCAEQSGNSRGKRRFQSLECRFSCGPQRISMQALSTRSKSEAGSRKAMSINFALLQACMHAPSPSIPTNCHSF